MLKAIGTYKLPYDVLNWLKALRRGQTIFTRLSDINPDTESSEVTRPFVVSVDADIPPGARVLLQLDGINGAGQPWRQVYLNPHRAIVPTPVFTALGLGVHPPPNNLAVPLVYAVIIEGHGRKRIYTAEALYQAADPSRVEAARATGANSSNPVELVLPKREPTLADDEETQDEGRNEEDASERELNGAIIQKPLLTRPLLPGAYVSPCDTTRPYILEIDGDAPADSQLIFTLSGRSKEGSPWQQAFQAPRYNHIIEPSRTAIEATDFHDLQFGVELRASSNGHHAPSLVSIAIEGDGRRFFLRAAELVGDLPLPEHIIASREVFLPAVKAIMRLFCT